VRNCGHQNDFYIVEQMRPETDEILARCRVDHSGSSASGVDFGFCRQALKPYGSSTKPSSSGARAVASMAGRDYIAHDITEFQRAGFHGGLNDHRAAESYFCLSAAWKGAKPA
jgi:hypothetical protein